MASATEMRASIHPDGMGGGAFRVLQHIECSVFIHSNANLTASPTWRIGVKRFERRLSLDKTQIHVHLQNVSTV
jgi:hypothetical protein